MLEDRVDDDIAEKDDVMSEVEECIMLSVMTGRIYWSFVFNSSRRGVVVRSRNNRKKENSRLLLFVGEGIEDRTTNWSAKQKR